VIARRAASGGKDRPPACIVSINIAASIAK
jgi:hypothetical protein